MLECPIGRLLREAPWVFDAVRACDLAEHGGWGLHQQSQWIQDALEVVSSERRRHAIAERKSEQAESDAKYAARLLKGG
jgi:hypothetical protein